MVDTPRLILRRFRPTDLDALVELNRDPEVMRYITGRPTPADEVRDRLLPEYLAHLDSAGDVAGLELGYRLIRDAWAGASPPRAGARCWRWPSRPVARTAWWPRR